MSSFDITIATDEVVAAAQALDAIDGAAINALLTRVVTEQAGKFDTRLRRAMNAGIALDDGYISSRMDIERTANVPRVTISAAGPAAPGRKGLTILGHYSPRVTTSAAKGKAKGDPSRGVPAGQRASGVQVEVRKGEPKTLTGAFTMTLRGSGKTGVFVREGGKARHLYGVSPYSLFRFQIGAQQEAMAAELQQAVVTALEKL